MRAINPKQPVASVLHVPHPVGPRKSEARLRRLVAILEAADMRGEGAGFVDLSRDIAVSEMEMMRAAELLFSGSERVKVRNSREGEYMVELRIDKETLVVHIIELASKPSDERS